MSHVFHRVEIILVFIWQLQMRHLSDVCAFKYSVLSVGCFLLGNAVSMLLSISAANNRPHCDPFSYPSKGCWTTGDGKDRRRSSDHLKHLSQLSRAKDAHSHTLQSGKYITQSDPLLRSKALSRIAIFIYIYHALSHRKHKLVLHV